MTLESGDDAVGPALDGTFGFLKAMPPLPPELFEEVQSKNARSAWKRPSNFWHAYPRSRLSLAPPVVLTMGVPSV